MGAIKTQNVPEANNQLVFKTKLANEVEIPMSNAANYASFPEMPRKNIYLAQVAWAQRDLMNQQRTQHHNPMASIKPQSCLDHNH